MEVKLSLLFAALMPLLVLAPSLSYATHSHPSPNDSNNKPMVNLIEKGPAATSASGINGSSGGKASNDNNPPSKPSNSIKVCNKQVTPGYDCFGNKINATPSTPPTTSPTSDTCPNGYGLVENTHEYISLSSPPPAGTGPAVCVNGFINAYCNPTVNNPTSSFGNLSYFMLVSSI